MGANILILGAAALAGVVSARALGPVGRGQLAVLVIWSGLIHTVGSLGLHSSCCYYLARWPGRRVELAIWFRRIAIRQAVAMTVVSVGFLWWLRVRLGLPTGLTIEYMTWAASATLALYGTMYAQGVSEFGRFNLIRAISGALPAVLMLVGALTLRMTTAEAGAAYLIPAWLSAVLAGIWFREACRGAQGEPLSDDELRSVWSYGWRSLASLSSLIVNSNSDQFTLGFLVSAGSLGLYSVGASAASPLLSVIASLGMVGLPTVTALTGRAKARATWKIMRNATVLVAVLAPAAAVALPWAIPWAYGARYSGAIAPAEVLLAGASFAALTTAVDALLRAYDRPGFVSVAQGAGGVLTVGGILLEGGHSLAEVALISSLGFVLSFALALGRLRSMTRYSAAHACRARKSASLRYLSIPEYLGRELLSDANNRIGRHVEVDDRTAPDD